VEKYCRAGQAIHNKNGTCTLHAVYLRLQVRTQIRNTLLFHCKNSYTDAHRCCVICTLPVLFCYILQNLFGLLLEIELVRLVQGTKETCLLQHWCYPSDQNCNRTALEIVLRAEHTLFIEDVRVIVSYVYEKVWIFQLT
jgi:hypothetical protein